MPDRYHHGDLRRAVLDSALTAIADGGASALSLRDLARRAGVSHAAPAHHFGDKKGVLTQIAVDGFDLLADALEAAEAGGTFVDVGAAYVRFAVAHPSHFEVMFRPDLLHGEDPALAAAEARARGPLLRGVAGASRADDVDGALAAWSLVHGFASLWLSGALSRDARDALGDDAEAAARRLAAVLDLGARQDDPPES